MPRLRICSLLLLIGAAIFFVSHARKSPAAVTTSRIVTSPPAKQKIKAIVVGSVQSPGEYALRGGCHLSDALAAADGFLRMAKTDVIVVSFLDFKKREEIKTYDFGAILEKTAPDPMLVEDIRVFVPERAY
jgi:protein involved in polysaccharide export with SLBB domain